MFPETGPAPNKKVQTIHLDLETFSNYRLLASSQNRGCASETFFSIRRNAAIEATSTSIETMTFDCSFFRLLKFEIIYLKSWRWSDPELKLVLPQLFRHNLGQFSLWYHCGRESPSTRSFTVSRKWSYSYDFSQRTLTLWGRITEWLVSSLTRLDLTKEENILFVCNETVKSNLVKLETSCTVILNPTVSALCFSRRRYCLLNQSIWELQLKSVSKLTAEFNWVVQWTSLLSPHLTLICRIQITETTRNDCF